MRTHEKVRKLLPRFEKVEWLYDGLGGKIIPWTKQHGGHSDDPACQAFVVDSQGTVISRCPDGRVHSGASFAKWLGQQAKDYARTHPSTAIPFALAEVTLDEHGESRSARCVAFQDARRASKRMLVYAGRSASGEASKKIKAQVKAARRFEKRTLGSKKAAEAARGWTLLRLDLAEPEHSAFAKQIGVLQAPALLMFLPGQKEPVALDVRRVRAPDLVYRLKKENARRK